MRRRSTSRKLDGALFEMPQKTVSLGLQTIWTAPLSGVEVLGGQVSHDFPIPLTLVHVFEPGFTNIPDVEGLVLLVEEEPAGGDEPVAAHLHDERGAVAPRVVAPALVLQSVALHHHTEIFVAHRPTRGKVP